MLGRWVQIPSLIAALVLGGWAARYAFSQGMHSVIRSEVAKPSATTQFPTIGRLSGCALDSHLQQENALRCQMEMRQAAAASRDEQYRLVFHAANPPGAPMATMTKAESETATGWFTAAMIAIPLSLLVAAVLGFLLYAAVTTEKDGSWG